MAISYRCFETKDFYPTLQFYNTYGKIEETTARMWKRMVLLDPNFDGKWFIIAEDEDKNIVGMIYVIRRLVPVDVGGTLESDKVWINAIAVAPGYTEEIGDQLIGMAEQFALSVKAEKIIATSYTPNFFTQGIDYVHYPEYCALFKKRGYSVDEESHSMRIDLNEFSYSEKTAAIKSALADEGIVFQELSEEYIFAFFDYLKTKTKPGWVCRMRKLLNDTDDLGRVQIARKGDEVIGFNMYGDPDTSINRYGPFGVSPDFRGKKIGRVLLEECLSHMKEHGLDYAWMQWASGDVAPGLYERTGFRVAGSYLIFEKKL